MFACANGARKLDFAKRKDLCSSELEAKTTTKSIWNIFELWKRLKTGFGNLDLVEISYLNKRCHIDASSIHNNNDQMTESNIYLSSEIVKMLPK